jgi:PAS domain S-box-containing protein
MEILAQPVRKEKENIVVFIMRLILYRIFIFRYLIDYEKRLMVKFIYKTFIFVFVMQIVYYVNYQPISDSSTNILFKTISNIIYYSNIENTFNNSSSQYIVYIYTGYMFLYILYTLIMLGVAVGISKRADFSKYMFYQYNKISVFFKIYAYLFFLNYYCVSIVGIKAILTSYLDQESLFSGIFQNQKGFKYPFLILLHLMMACYLIDHIFELILHIYNKKKTNNFSRTSQFEFLLIILLRFGIILYSILNINFRSNIAYSVIVFLVLTLLVVTSFVRAVYYCFEIHKLFRKTLIYVWLVSLMNLAHIGFKMNELVIYFAFIFMFFFIFDHLIFEFYITGKLIRSYDAFSSPKFQRDEVRSANFEKFFISLFYIFNNFKFLKHSHWLPLYIFEKHVMNCPDVDCYCRQISSKSSKNFFEEIINLFFEKYKNFFDNHEYNELALVKLNIINDFRENFFASYIYLVSLWNYASSTGERINLFSLIIDVDFMLKRLDKKFTEESGLDSQKLPLLYEKIVSLKKEMISTAQKYKTMWQEVVEANPDYSKLSTYIEEIILKMNLIEKRFKEIYKKSKNNYANLYNYSIFMINVFNYDEGAKKLIDQLTFIKKNIDSIDEKLAIISQKFAENSNSMILFASGNLNHLTYITNVYFNYKEFLGYERDELVGHKVTEIIPERIAISHDLFVLRFFETSKGTFFNKNRIVTCIGKGGYIIPGEVLLRIMPNIQQGIQFVLYFTNEMFILKNSFVKPELFTQGLANYILFDDKKKVIGISDRLAKSTYLTQALVKNIAQKNHLTNCYITDIFPDLEKNAELNDKFFGGDTVVMSLKYSSEDEKMSKIKMSTMIGSNDSKSKTLKDSVWEDSHQVYAKLAYSESYNNGTINISMMYFFDAILIQMMSKEETENDNKIVAETRVSKTPKKSNQMENDLKAEKNSKQINSKAIKEIQTSFLKKFAPKTDLLIKAFIILLFITNFGLFIYKMIDEQSKSLNFFELFPKNSLLLNQEIIYLNKIMEFTNSMNVGMSSAKSIDNAIVLGDLNDEIKSIEKFYQRAQLTSPDLSFIFENSLSSQIDVVALQGIYFNITVRYPNIVTKNITFYNATLSTMMTEVISLIYYIYKSNINDLMTKNATSENIEIRNKLLNYFGFIMQNVFYNLDMNIGELFRYKVLQIESVLDSLYMNGTLFFGAKLSAILLNIILIMVLLIRYNNSTFIIMSIFTKIEKNNCLGNIQRCENFIEIMDFLDKNNINKIELSHQLQENLFEAKDKIDFKNKAVIKSKVTEIDKLSDTQENDKVKINFKKNRCGLNKEVVRMVSVLFVVPILIISNMILFLNYNVPIKNTLINLENLSFYSDCHNINYVLNRERILQRFDTPQIYAIGNWTETVLESALTIPQIFMNNKVAVFKNSINDIINLMNTNLCVFWTTYRGNISSCDDPIFSEILSKGLSTSMVYIDNQLKILLDTMTSKKTTVLTVDNHKQLSYLESLNLVLVDSINLATDLYFDEILSSKKMIQISYDILLSFEIAIMVLFISIFLVVYSRYFYFKKLFFEKVFILVSLKTIGENKGLFAYLKRKVNKKDEI